MGGQVFQIDPASDTVRITGSGMWRPQDAKAHFAEVEQALRPLRSAGRRLLFLVDMREAVVQSPETALAMRWGAMRMHRSTDVVAVVTKSVLHALQVKMVSEIACLETFQDMDKAIAWANAQRVPA
jgi:hypothetical protein